MKISKLSSILIGALAANSVYAGNMGDVMELSPDSRIRANIILFDTNQLYLRDSLTATSVLTATSASASLTESSQNFTTGFYNIPFFVDGLVLDYEKDINKILPLKYDVRPMVGMRVLGKLGNSSSSSVVILNYPNVTSNISGSAITNAATDAITLRPWGLMGALYLGVNKSFYDKLSIAARVGPVLSALDLNYRRTLTTGNIAPGFYDTFQKAVTKIGYGGFGSIEAGYQITKNLNITTELMYSGFTTGKINTTYTHVNPTAATPVVRTNVTGYINAPYISDIMGMVGVEYKF